MAKTAILLVAHGSSILKTQKVLKNLHKQALSRFPGYHIDWAYTSAVVREKLSYQGCILNSPLAALTRLLKNGYRTVYVQSLHIIKGNGYHDLSSVVDKIKSANNSFELIRLGLPLLSSHVNFPQIAEAMLKGVPKERQQHDGILFIGHGSKHEKSIDSTYMTLQSAVNKKDRLALIGVLNGTPTIDRTINNCINNNIKNIYLIPLMSIAGVHARKDIVGAGKASVKTRLTQKGIHCIPVLSGILENTDIINIWLDNLELIMQ